MKSESKSIQLVQFEEHPHVKSRNRNSSEHAILLTAGFSMEDYCQSLFHKVLTIGLSELPAFLEYQCKSITEPEKWLNTLEKLVKVNAAAFNTAELEHRRSKLITEFAIHRQGFKNTLIKKRIGDLSTNVIAFSIDKQYDFSKVLEQCRSLSSHEEKVLYLHKQIYDYAQDTEKFTNNNSIPFDKRCQLHLDHLEKEEEIRHKAALRRAQESGLAQTFVKIQIHSKTNYFVDIFYQLRHDAAADGKPTIRISDRQIAEHINACYLDRNGKEISVKYVLTILENNRTEKRPKGNKRFDLGKI